MNHTEKDTFKRGSPEEQAKMREAMEDHIRFLRKLLDEGANVRGIVTGIRYLEKGQDESEEKDETISFGPALNVMQMADGITMHVATGVVGVMIDMADEDHKDKLARLLMRRMITGVELGTLGVSALLEGMKMIKTKAPDSIDSPEGTELLAAVLSRAQAERGEDPVCDTFPPMKNDAAAKDEDGSEEFGTKLG